MATPKKANKIRDYDRTRKKLLEVIGEILKDTGFTGLKTNQIARRLGKDKNLIRYYFQSLYNLEKEFIVEKDHWLAYFRKLELPQDPAGEELIVLVLAFVQEHFDFFSRHQELQKIMLWQLTENSPLLKTIADLREKESEKLLKAASPYLNPNVSLGAVLALLFGGLYFLSLLEAAGNGPLWGMDMRLEKDRIALFHAVEQILRLALANGIDGLNADDAL